MARKNNKKCVLHYTDGREAWKKTISYLILSKQGIAGAIILSMLSMGSWPFWWPSDLKNKSIGLESILIVVSIMVVLIALFGLIYLRRRTIRSLDIKFMLHQFMHDMRDYHSRLFRYKKEIHKNKDRDFTSEYSEHLLCIANHIRELFRRLINNSSIEVAIRLAYPIERQEGNVEYITRVRTSGLNQNRSETSEPIKANKGIPRYLIEKKSHEVLIYQDIKQAIEFNLFQKTENEEKYPDEIKTMIVCPLNAFDGIRCSMIGILYIVARDENLFKEEHVDYARFVSDATANSISIATMMYKIINSFSKKKGI